MLRDELGNHPNECLGCPLLLFSLGSEKIGMVSFGTKPLGSRNMSFWNLAGVRGVATISPEPLENKNPHETPIPPILNDFDVLDLGRRQRLRDDLLHCRKRL